MQILNEPGNCEVNSNDIINWEENYCDSSGVAGVNEQLAFIGAVTLAGWSNSNLLKGNNTAASARSKMMKTLRPILVPSPSCPCGKSNNHKYNCNSNNKNSHSFQQRHVDGCTISEYGKQKVKESFYFVASINY